MKITRIQKLEQDIKGCRDALELNMLLREEDLFIKKVCSPRAKMVIDKLIDEQKQKLNVFYGGAT